MKTNSTKTTDKPLAFLYGRCSSAKQIDGDSERRQWQDGETVAAQHGFSLADEKFFDAGVSAYRGANLTEKAKLGVLLERLQPGQALIFENMDRFSRQNWFTAAKAFERFLAKGVKVIVNRQAVTLESFQRDPGSFLPVIMASHLGHDEDRKKSERVKAAWVTKRAEILAGTGIRQRLPGWLYRETTQTPDGKVITGAVKVNEAKAATVRQIFAWALQGWGRRRIAAELTARKVATVSGQSDRWHAESINICILRNQAVIGNYAILDQATGKPTGEVAKGIFPAIVSERDFYAVQSVRSKIAERSAPVKSVSNCLVTGLTFCPSCGGPMQHHTNHTGTGRTYRYLLCQDHKAGRSSTPEECKRRISYTNFEESLLCLMSQSAKVKASLGQASAQPDAMAELRGRLATADKLSEDYQRGFESVAPTAKMLAAWQKTDALAEALRAQLQKLEAQAKATTPPAQAYESLLPMLAELSKSGEGRAQIKNALRDVIEKIQFNSTVDYTIRFRGGKEMLVYMSRSNAPIDLAKSRMIGNVTPALP